MQFIRTLEHNTESVQVLLLVYEAKVGMHILANSHRLINMKGISSMKHMARNTKGTWNLQQLIRGGFLPGGGRRQPAKMEAVVGFMSRCIHRTNLGQTLDERREDCLPAPEHLATTGSQPEMR